MTPLRQLVYGSSTPQPLDSTAIADILRTSRRNNAAVGVTGALLYADGNFLQVLEGAPDAVAEVYDRVQRDARHRGVLTLLDRTVTERQFPDWSMGLVDADALSGDDLDAVQALYEVDTPGPGPVRHMLTAFRATMSGTRTRVHI